MPWLQHRWFIFCCISILVFKDCQSLFVRNTQSGKCIATKKFDVSFFEDSFARRYWANLTDNCLRDDAQFRFLKQKDRTELLSNIETGGTLATIDGESSTSRYKKRFFIYVSKMSPFGTDSRNNLKQTDDGALYFYNSDIKTCGKPDSTFTYVNNDVTSDGNDCDEPEQKFTFGSVTDFNSKLENVGCSSKQRMLISRADYGNFVANKNFDNNTVVDTKCSTITNCEVKSRCGESTSCELTFDQSLLPPQYCPDTKKEIYTEYTCVDKYPSTLITSAAPNIRLWNVITGSISVKNANSEWITTDDNNWSKERQKMLCQYLGLEETDDNPLKAWTFTTGEIATGDVICHNTQASTTSCCVSLETTTIISSTKLPAAQCKLKMCDNPIFKSSSSSSTFVFSGRGSSRSSDYKRASFHSSGWCPTQSGDKYLLIDLKKDHHITRVVTMGDRDQTKWGGSYSLKHSYDKSLVDSSSAEHINGNQNGHEASYTSVNIYNARYMKIESTGTTDFCLRIEFCGEGQHPAPVKDINVVPSIDSAIVSWNIEGPQSSSYITEYNIYLNDRYLMTVSRSINGTSAFVGGLKFYTDYTVGIMTQDSAAQKSNITYKKFKIGEADILEPPKEINGSYIINMKKPIMKWRKIQKVALVLLQLNSKSNKPESPVNVTIQDSLSKDENEDNVAFIAKEFDISDFTKDTIDVVIREKKLLRTKKRNSVNVELDIIRNTTFQASQRSTDENGNYFWSPWTKPFTIMKASSTLLPRNVNVPPIECSEKGSGTDWYILVVLFVSGVIVGVLLIYIVICFRRRFSKQKHQSSTESPTTNVDPMYEDLDLRKMNTEDNYQSLKKNAAYDGNSECENDPNYTDLKKERDVENTYQTLT